MLKFPMAKFHIIIPAAGSGSRMGLDQPKQYLKIHKQTFIERVIRVFENIPLVDSIHIALKPKDDLWNTLNPMNSVSIRIQRHAQYKQPLHLQQHLLLVD